MAVKMYTYTSLRELRELSFYDEIRTLPYVAASTDLALALLRDDAFHDVVSMDELQSTVMEDWQDDRTVFQQYVLLGSILRELSANGGRVELYESFRKNKRDVLNSIRFLDAADVHPADLEPDCEELVIFRKIWEQYEADSSQFSLFQKKMAELEQEPEKFVRQIIQNWPMFAADQVVMVGFFYITPIQQRFIDLFERAGKEIIYLCCMHPALRKVQEIWEEAYRPEWGFPERKQRTAGSITKQKNASFAELFDRGYASDGENYSGVKIIKYRTELDFVQDAARIANDGLQLFSADTEFTENLLKTFYPEAFQRRHLLAYPVGQYIYRLHTLWDQNEHCLIVRHEDVKACFASGWLSDGKQNGKDFMEALELLKPYTERCRTLDDWRYAFDALKQAKQMLNGTFEAHLNDVPKKHRAEHRLMADPFLNLSCFSVSLEDILHVEAMAEKLFHTAESLFGDEKINISRHLEKLQKILNQKPAEDVLYDAEKTVAEELLSRLQFGRLNLAYCAAEDITEAIMLIIGGGILNENQLSFEDPSKTSFIRHISKIEPAPLMRLKGVHLCMADEKRLPGGEGKLSWPLSDPLLEKMENRIDGRRKLWIHEMRIMTKAAPLVKRYLFFSLLQNENVEISWIENEGENVLAASPYVQLLRAAFQPEYTEFVQEKRELKAENTVPPLQMSFDERDILSREKLGDLRLCRWRYLYGYILHELPSYRTDFHYQFALSKITAALAEVCAVPQASVAKEIFSLLPYYRRIEEQQIEDYSSMRFIGETDELDDISYPRARLMPHYLVQRIADRAEFALEKETPYDHSGPETETARDTCMFCPFSETCPHAVRDEE